MAYTELTVQSAVPAGLDPTYVAATLTDGNMFRNTGKQILHVVNGSGGELTMTLVTPATVVGLAIADQVVTVPNGEERMCGHLDVSTYNQTGTDAGKVYVTYSTVTSVTVAVVQ
ncbi:MAG: hypothetical protein DRQ56_03605 [Gammaproteobacteria bacterium]|nr:MAG: hypothetical protein DRQ56_03605 [Gammaproteobacteria bacterium]